MNILFLFGGQSREHEVSLVSAAYMLEELHKLDYTIYTVAIHKDGIWHLTNVAEQLIHAKSHGALFIPENTPEESEQIWTVPSQGIWKNTAQPTKMDIQCVIPIMHGYSGEDGLIQGMLELANVPCAGCDSTSSNVCMNKHITKLVLEHFNIPTTPYITIHERHFIHDSKKIITQCLNKFSLPLIIKTTDGGSSVGIFTPQTEDELHTALQDAFQLTNSIIIEPLLQNIREIEVSIISKDNDITSFPAGEIVIPSKQVYDYNFKYKSNHTYPQIPADIPHDINKQIQELAEEVFVALSCSGFARIDFFLTEENTIYVNEVNTIPGCTPLSMFTKMVNQKLTTGELLQHIIASGIQNHEIQSRKKISH